jgi:DNA invertase Pin-like site-specific DNA recombinase
MQNVVGYVCVSTQGQVRDGYSLQYQMDEIIKYCEENSMNLIRIYEDRE